MTPSKGILGVPGLPGAKIVRAGTGGGGNMGTELFCAFALEKGRERGKGRLAPTRGCFWAEQGPGEGVYSLQPPALQFPLLTPVTLPWPGYGPLRKVESWPAGSWPAHVLWPNPGVGASYCLGRRKQWQCMPPPGAGISCDWHH